MRIKIRSATRLGDGTRMTVNGKEITEPKQKRNFHIFIMFFLGFFVAALIFALVTIINQSTHPGEFVYYVKEEVHVEEASYHITVIDRAQKYGDATAFTVDYSENSYVSVPTAVVSSFKKTTKNGDVTYTFTVKVTGENWDKVSGISSVHMQTDSGLYLLEKTALAENMWVVFLVIGIFIAVLTTLIVLNGKWAVREHKNSKSEINAKIAATRRAVARYNNPQLAAESEQTGAEYEQNSEPEINPNPIQNNSEESDLTIKCPYCHTENNFSSSKCKNCDAPLR